MNNPPSAPPPPPGGAGDPQPGYGQPQPGQQPNFGSPHPGLGQPASGAPQPGYSQAPPPNYGQPQQGYSDPQQGYHTPQAQNPYVAQTEYGTPVAPYESGQKKKGRGLLIGGGVVGAAVLIGGGVFAANALLGSSGTHPYEVLPKDSFAYAEVDFDPEADQKTAYLRIKDQFVEEFDLDEDADLFEGLATPLGNGLDYETDVEPWLGDRVGFSAVESSEDPTGMVAYIAYQISDADKLGDVRDKLETSSLVQGEYLIVSSSSNEDLLPESGFSGVLEDRDGFTSALNSLDGNTIASMWVDLEAAAEMATATMGDEFGLDGEFGDFSDFGASGTIVAGVHLDQSFIQAQIKVIDIDTPDALASDLKLNEGDVADVMRGMPANSGVAFAIGGLDVYVNEALESALASPEMADVSEMLEAMKNELRLDIDIFAPETITGILGTTTGFHATEEGGALYSAEGDAQLLEQIGEILTELADMPIDVTTEGNTVVTSMGGSGSGKLGDASEFDKALHNLDSSHFALYLEPAAVDPYTDDVGVFGITGKASGDSAEITVRWLLP